MMEHRRSRFQFSLQWLMLQISLWTIAAALFHHPPANDLESFAWWSAIFALTGAIIGGCFGNFRLGAAMGFMHSLIFLAVLSRSSL